MLFYIESNLSNKHMGIFTMVKSEELQVLTPEQHGNKAAKVSDTRALNTSLFYDLIRLKRVPETSIFEDLISNYDLVVHSIASIYL